MAFDSALNSVKYSPIPYFQIRFRQTPFKANATGNAFQPHIDAKTLWGFYQLNCFPNLLQLIFHSFRERFTSVVTLFSDSALFIIFIIHLNHSAYRMRWSNLTNPVLDILNTKMLCWHLKKKPLMKPRSNKKMVECKGFKC